MIDVLAGPAHPTFAAHFADPLYRDATDEFGPFAAELAWDVAAAWTDRRDELTASTTLRGLAEEEFGGAADADDVLAPAPELSLVLDPVVVGLGFALLRSTGRIDPEGRALLVEALQRLEVGYGELTDHYGRMISDVESFALDQRAAA